MSGPVSPFTQDGTLAVSGSDDGTVIVWRAVIRTAILGDYDRTVGDLPIMDEREQRCLESNR